jgi:hypothetical protein
VSFPNDVRGVALNLVDLLERNAVPYALMGGMAVPVWGIPRATYDIDVVLSLDEEGLRRFISLATSEGFQVDPPYESGFRDVLAGMEKIRIEWWTQESRRVEVDVFLVTTAYQEAAFSRRCRVQIDGRQVWVLSAADLVLHKLVAGRPKDLADIQNILAIQGIPDAQYLDAWAHRLNVENALRKAIEDMASSKS